MTGLWPSLIDPQLQLDRLVRKSVYRDAWGRWLNTPHNTILYTGGLLGALFVYLFVPDLIEPMIGGHRWFHTLIWSGLYLIAVAVLIVIFRNYGYARCVYAELRERGHDVCKRCGYLLAQLGQEHDRCPECGQKRGAAPPTS